MAGTSRKAKVLVGDAEQTLLELGKDLQGMQVDGIFIDGNKGAYVEYLNWAEKHVRPGGLIVGDNVFLRGQVFNGSKEGSFGAGQISAMQEFNRRLADTKRYQSVILPTGEGLFVAKFLG